MSSRYPLATSTWDHREREALQRVVDSGRFTMGAEVEALEREFAAAMGSRHCVMVNSGSSANLLMVAALMYRREGALREGDEVIVPAVSWPTTYYPLQQHRLRLKFVDIDLGTLNFDLEALERAIGPRTRAVLCVNLLGNPNDFDRVRALLAGRDILLLEDNCESMGAAFGGRRAGTFGLMGTFSSFFSHHISTMEGGYVVTDEEELHHVLLCLRAHGWTRNLPKVNHVCGVKGDDAFEESWRFVLPGYNLRPLEIEAAVGREQVAKLEAFLAARRENAVRFRARFGDHPHFLIQRETGISSWFGFSLVIRPESGLDRKEVVKALQASGVECRPIVAGNFAKNPVLKWFDHEIPFPLRNAETVDARGLLVGNHHYPLGPEFEALEEALEGALARLR